MVLNFRSYQNITLPNQEALSKCKEVATTPEGACYFAEQFEKRLDKAGKVSMEQAAIANIRQFSEMISMQREMKSNCWEGEMVSGTDFHNLQQNVAVKSAEFLNSRVEGNIRMDFALNDKAQLLRGYSVNGKLMEEESTHSLDNLFNAWLASQNLMSKGSVIYAVDDKGKILRDDKGVPIVVNTDRLNTKILSEGEDGFTHFLQKHSKQLQLTLKQRSYPAATKPEIPKVVEEAATIPEASTSYKGTPG